MEAVQLRTPLSFQEVLDTGFVELEDQQAGMVVDTARYELLVTQARLFGGLFLLDPDQALPLDAAAAPRFLGSSLDPDDQVGPDGESLIYGLNTCPFARDGLYSFEHGTSGGGILITATEPNEQQLAQVAPRTRNAIAYARLKEQILSESTVLRCDVMDGNYIVTERRCSYEEFKAHVVDMAEQVKAAGLQLGTEEDLDFKLCNVALPGAIEAQLRGAQLQMACLVAQAAIASLVLAAASLLLWPP
ncbi:Hypothetical protein SCF082_LOCUS37951 [Durusdinium trenchii]|uniref:Uncharacterized protein n=1 Tax=Durusdinium trenchii TaxID=1381693 RepID=A0ABP0PU39_9DINO